MRLKPEQLHHHLQKSSLLPLYFISGDEPLQVLEAVDRIRNSAREQGVNERTLFTVEKGFDWNGLHQANSSMSLFAERQLIELRLDTQKPGKEGGAALIEYTQNYAEENILLISAAKVDKKTQQSKWFKALESIGAIIQIWAVEPAQLPRWISQRCQQQQKKIDQDAANLIAQRVEGNLLAAKQEIDKLCLLVDEPQITLQHAIQTVMDSSRFDVFDLIENACIGNLEKARRMLLSLKNEGVEPIGIFGALMWEFRRIKRVCHEVQSGAGTEQVFAKYRIWQQRKNTYNKLIRRLHSKELNAMLAAAAQLDKVLKGAAQDDSWQLLEKFIFRLGGTTLAIST